MPDTQKGTTLAERVALWTAPHKADAPDAETRPIDMEPGVRIPLTFNQWKRQVNREVYAIAYVTCDDIGDAQYYDNWDAGVSPRDMAREALEESDFPFED